VVHLGAKKCLQALEVVLHAASDALAAAMAAAEAGADEPTRRRACAASLRGFSAEEVQHSSEGGKVLCRSKLSELRKQLQLASINASSSERKELGALWTLLKDAEQAERNGHLPNRFSNKFKVRVILSGAAVGGALTALIQELKRREGHVCELSETQPQKASSLMRPGLSASPARVLPKTTRLRKDATEGERIAAMLGALAEYISCCGGDGNYVLSTFSATLEYRKEGSTAGTSDIYYFNESGRRFRSRADVARALGLVPLTGGPGQRSKPTSGKKDGYFKASEATRQRAKRLESKIEKALEKRSRRIETMRRNRKIDDTNLDPLVAPDLAVLGRPFIYANINANPTVSASHVARILSVWHFLRVFANELGIGVSHDDIYNNDDETRNLTLNTNIEISRRRAAAQKDRAILRAGPMELARRLLENSAPIADSSGNKGGIVNGSNVLIDADGFIFRVHLALLRVMLTDVGANAWWANGTAVTRISDSCLDSAVVSTTAQAQPAPSDGTSKRLRAMAARVKLDAQAVLESDVIEDEEITKRWLEALEGIRHLKTNSGNPIRDGILAALETTSNLAVKQFLKRCLSWWRCNAAGTTKHAALQVLDLMRLHKPMLLNANFYPAPTSIVSSNGTTVLETLTPSNLKVIEGEENYDEAWDFDSQLCGQRVVLPNGTGFVVSVCGKKVKILMEFGSQRGKAMVVATDSLAIQSDAAAAKIARRLKEARSLHNDDAPRPETTHVKRWDLLASAVAVRLAAQDDALRSYDADGLCVVNLNDSAAARDRTIGDVHFKVCEPFAWCGGNICAVDPLVTATDKLRCGGTYTCLAAPERAALLDALTRGATRTGHIAAVCDAHADTWKVRDRETTDIRKATKELSKKRREVYECKAYEELERRARHQADERLKRAKQQHRVYKPVGSSTRGLNCIIKADNRDFPMAHDEDQCKSDNVAAIDYLAEARSEICTDDKIRRLAERLADARAFGCNPREELVIYTRDQLYDREARVAAASDCEASAMRADHAANSNGAALAHIYTRLARDNLHAIRRHAFHTFERAINISDTAKRNNFDIEVAIRGCESAQFTGRFPADSDSKPKRWILDTLKRGYLALRDLNDIVTTDRAGRQSYNTEDIAPSRGHVLGIDRLGRAYAALEHGLEHASRIWCLPHQDKGPWYQIEEPANLHTICAHLDTRGYQESTFKVLLGDLLSEEL